MLHALIVDDEPPARLRVRTLLEEQPDLRVSECSNGAEAVEAIVASPPDLLFLDVQMPELDGFGLIARLLTRMPADRLPVTVFITAFDHYALRAFEAHALDYVLKPFTDERFEQALARALSHVRLRQRDALAGRMLALLHETQGAPAALAPAVNADAGASPAPASPALDRLVVRVGRRVLFLRPDEIDWVEAAGVYVYLHVGGEKHLHRASLTALEARLAAAGFVRIHRSALVNFARIRELSPHTHGEFGVTMSDGRRLRLTRSFRARLEERLGHPL